MKEEIEYGVTIHATRNQIEDFKQSLLWNDIQRELEFWIKGFEMEQSNIVDDTITSNTSTASVLLRLGDLNGRKKAVNYMLEILDIFLDILEEKKDDSEHK